jgi:hypothetical protein
LRQQAALIAVGTRGRPAPFGSIARELIGFAEVPVLIVGPHARLPHFAPRRRQQSNWPHSIAPGSPKALKVQSTEPRAAAALVEPPQQG